MDFTFENPNWQADTYNWHFSFIKFDLRFWFHPKSLYRSCSVDCEYLAYFLPKKNIVIFFAHENIRKPASKIAHNRPPIFFFSVLPTGPKSYILFHKNVRLLYNDLGSIWWTIYRVNIFDEGFLATLHQVRPSFL